MPNLPKSKPLAALLAVAALLALPAAAHATLSYTKTIKQPYIFYAKDNGKGAHKIGPGYNSHVSPDGELVIYERSTANSTEMRLYSIAAGKSERLLNNWAESYVFAWSPDSTEVAAMTGGLNGPYTLVVINVETMKRTKVATGYFNGVSFSPNSEEIVYGIAQTFAYTKSNVFRYKIGSSASKALTHNGTSGFPLWGPGEQIVFVRFLGAKQRQYGPKNDLFTMNPEGQRISRLTETEVNPLAQGLIPLGWSESGNQLLAEFGGEDQSYAVAINTLNGNERALTKDVEMGFVGSAISPDGKTVLGTVGLSFGGGNPQPKVATIPFKGGKITTLVKGGYEPSWGS